MPSAAEVVPAEYDLLCESCGYSLLGLMHTRVCPECGQPFDPDVLPLARVPWLYRIRLGAVSAYIQTVHAILKDPTAFAAELCRPARICWEDARAFRRVTGWIAGLSVMLLVLGFAAMLLPTMSPSAPYALGAAVGALVAVRVFVALATDTPTFIWPAPDPDDPHNLSAIQCYSGATLSLFAVPAAFWLLVLFVQEVLPGAPPVLHAIPLLLAVLATLGLIYSLCRASVAFMRVEMRCSRWRGAALAIYLPFHYALFGGICAVGGAILSYIAAFFFSALFLLFN